MRINDVIKSKSNWDCVNMERLACIDPLATTRPEDNGPVMKNAPGHPYATDARNAPRDITPKTN